MMVNKHQVAMEALPASGRSKLLGELGAPNQPAGCQPPPAADAVGPNPPLPGSPQPQPQQHSRDRIRGDSARSTQNALEALHELEEEQGRQGEAAPLTLVTRLLPRPSS